MSSGPLIIALTVFLLYLLFQDWVTVPRFNESQTDGVGFGQRVAISAGNVLPPLLLLVLVLASPRTGPLPWWTLGWGALYCAAFLVLVWLAWYGPYLRGTTAQRTAEYRAEFAGTLQVLPARGDHPRPNLAHVVLHLLFLATAVLFVIRASAT